MIKRKYFPAYYLFIFQKSKHQAICSANFNPEHIPPNNISGNFMDLDKLDKQILNLLQADATLPLKELAQAVHSSVATCQRRIRRLSDNGIILKQVALVSPQAVGRGISVFVQVEMSRQNPAEQEAFERLMRREADVTGCYEISGDYDFLLLVHAYDMAHYHAFTRRVMTDTHNVRTFKSQFVMNFAKAETKIELS